MVIGRRSLLLACVASLMLACSGGGGGGGGGEDALADLAAADGVAEIQVPDGLADTPEGFEPGDVPAELPAGDIPLADLTETSDGQTWDVPPDGIVGPFFIQGLSALGEETPTLFYNPDAYDSLPFRVWVAGAKTVTIQVGDVGPQNMIDPDWDGIWLGNVDVSEMTREGEVDVLVTAYADGEEPVTRKALLVAGTAGVQISPGDNMGYLGTPSFHVHDGIGWLVWTDRSKAPGTGVGYMRDMNGAGLSGGDAVPIVDEEAEARHTRAAFAGDMVGLLYQVAGSPLANRFKVLDLSGGELLAPMDLDADGFTGAAGGDIAWDGAGWVLAWRSQSPEGSRIDWMRVDADGFNVVGPVNVVLSGAGTIDDPLGSIANLPLVSVETADGGSLVSWVQDIYNPFIMDPIPRGRISYFSPAGVQTWGGPMDTPGAEFWVRECGLGRLEDGPFAAWIAQDLFADDEPPFQIYAGAVDVTGAAALEATLLFEEAGERDELVLAGFQHEEFAGAIAWLDNAPQLADPQAGVEIRGAGITTGYTTGPHVHFNHPVVTAGNAALRGARVGTNVILTWIDHRDAGGESQTATYMETLWY